MCGITGVVSNGNITEQLFEGMSRLEYRGYDSAGMAVLNGSMAILKDEGKIVDVQRRHNLLGMYGNAGIAHTRWATHGEINEANSHPHASEDNRFAIVHNGIIENYRELRRVLEMAGYTFRSQTDSEVIVHLIADRYKYGLSVEQAVRATAAILEGTYAFALITEHAPYQLFCARNGSPIVIGVGTHSMYLASDASAFAHYTRKAVYLKDGEYAVLRPNDYTIKSLESGGTIFRSPETLSEDVGQDSDLGNYPHYMLKEIHEGALVVERALAIPQSELVAVAQSMLESRQVFFTGVGSTYYAALIAQYYFAQLVDCHIPVISADEFSSLGKLGPKSLLLALSQSGETYDTLKALEYAKARGGKRIVVVNAPGSTMTRDADQVILQGAGQEVCVLSTKSLISQVTIMLRIALELALLCREIDDAEYAEHYKALRALPDTLRDMYADLVPHARRIGETYCNVKNWFFIGRGIHSAVALESALKFKEGSYLHAEGTPGGSLKHGIISLIDEHTNTMAFLPPVAEHDLLHATLNNVQEIRARNGFVIGVHHQKDDSLKSNFDDVLILPDVPLIVSPLVQLTAGQMLAYHTALALGNNIDKPRALAKSVTVA